MKHRKMSAGEALPKTNQLGYVAPLPSREVIAHLERAVRMFGNASKFSKACGIPQPSFWYILNGRRCVYAEMAVAIEHATGGEVARWQLRPDLWEEPDAYVDVTHMVGSRRVSNEPEEIAREDVAVRAYLDARHRLAAARSVLIAVLGLDQA